MRLGGQGRRAKEEAGAGQHLAVSAGVEVGVHRDGVSVTASQ